MFYVPLTLIFSVLSHPHLQITAHIQYSAHAVTLSRSVLSFKLNFKALSLYSRAQWLELSGYESVLSLSSRANLFRALSFSLIPSLVGTIRVPKMPAFNYFDYYALGVGQTEQKLLKMTNFWILTLL